MKLTTGKNNNYQIQVEPGDTINISFDPNGILAPLGGAHTRHAVTIGSISLPCGLLALSLVPDSDLLYSRGDSLILHSGSLAARVEFELCDGVIELEKVDLQELLHDD